MRIPPVLPSAPKKYEYVGAVQEQYFDYPYGGLVASIGSYTNHYKFTGKERDSETGLDMFGARYYGSGLGRFMTPDCKELQECRRKVGRDLATEFRQQIWELSSPLPNPVRRTVM